MIYTSDDIARHAPALRNYVRCRVRTDAWKDVVQDTLVYLLLKFEQVIITDLLGLVLNTANFFIMKHYRAGAGKIEYVGDMETRYMYAVTSTKNPTFMIGSWNGNDINDRLYANLRRASKTLLTPFEMQLDDRSIRQIAAELGTNENTVKTRIRRCKEYLKTGI